MKLYPDPDPRARRKVFETGDEVGRPGAEGTVYKLVGEPGTVAKVFGDPKACEREAKLRELVSHAPPPSPDGRPRYAWPRFLLYDEAGLFAGYAMARAEGVTLDTYIYPNPKDGKLAERRFRVGLAREVSARVAEIHRHELGIVLGDVSPANFLADPTGRVTLIDIDSVQITTVQGKTYLCPTKTGDYTAPELVGRDLAKVVREPEQDLFGLGVLNHELLRDGWHPFAARNARWREEQIASGECPLITGGAGVPPDAPLLNELPKDLRELLRRTFVDGQTEPGLRPNADAWERPLWCYEKRLGRLKAGVNISPPAVLAPAAQMTLTAVAAAAAPWRGWKRGAALAFGATAAAVFAFCLVGGADLWGGGGGGAKRRKEVVTANDSYGWPQSHGRRGETPHYWKWISDGGGRLSFEPYEVEALLSKSKR